MTDRETGGEEIIVGGASFPWTRVTTPELYQVPIYCWVDRGLGPTKNPLQSFSLRPGLELGPSRL